MKKKKLQKQQKLLPFSKQKPYDDRQERFF